MIEVSLCGGLFMVMCLVTIWNDIKFRRRMEQNMDEFERRWKGPSNWRNDE